MPLGASGEILRVVKENEVELEPSRRTPACVEPETAGTSPASPQHHFTALRDMGDAHSQPFRRDSTGQDVEGDLGRGDVANRDHSVSLPGSEGFAADGDDPWVFKKRKIRSVVCVVGLEASEWLQDGQRGV